MNKEEFLVNGNKGVRITFKNGVSVSIQWGPFNYCNNNAMKTLATIQEPRKDDHWFCKNAEIAIWDHEGEWVTKKWCGKDHDDVIGYQSPKDALSALIWAEKYEPTRTDKKES